MSARTDRPLSPRNSARRQTPCRSPIRLSAAVPAILLGALTVGASAQPPTPVEDTTAETATANHAGKSAHTVRSPLDRVRRLTARTTLEEPKVELPQRVNARLFLSTVDPANPPDRQAVADALATLEQAVDSEAVTPDLLVAMGRGYRTVGRDEKAVAAYASAWDALQGAERPVRRAKVLLEFIEALETAGNGRAALDALDRLQSRLEESPRRYARDDGLRELIFRPQQLLTRRGRLLLSIDRPAQAANVLMQSFEMERSRPKTARLLVEAMLQAGQCTDLETLLLDFATEPALSDVLTDIVGDVCLRCRDAKLPRRFAEDLRQRNRLDGKLAVALAAAATELNRPHDASVILTDLIKRVPGDPDVATRLVELYVRQGRYERALRLLADVLGEDPTAVDAVTQGLQRIVEAETPVDLEDRFAVTLNAGKSDHPFALHYVAGRLAEAKDDVGLAVEQYREALDAKPDFAPVYQALGRVYLARGKTRRLNALVTRARKAFGENHYFPMMLRGQVHLEQGQFEKAFRRLTEARARNPQDVQVLLAYAQAAVRTGNAQQAADALTTAIRAVPDNVQVHRMLFNLLLAGRNFSQASQVLTHLRQVTDDDIVTDVMEAELALRRGRLQDAAEILRRLEDEHPDAPQRTLLDAQLALLQHPESLPRPRFNDVVAALMNIIDDTPGNEPARRLLQQVLQRQGKQARARVVWKRLYEEHPDQRALTAAYASALVDAERWHEAVDVLKQLAAANERDLTAQIALIEALMKLDRTEQAHDRLQEVRELVDEWIAEVGEPAAEALRAQELRLLASAKQYDALIEAGREWIGHSPDSATPRRLLVSLLAAGKQYAAAHELLNEWIREGETIEAMARQLKFALFVESGQIDGARDFALEWIDAQSSLVLPRELLIGTLIQNDRYDEALRLLDAWTKDGAAGTETRPDVKRAVDLWARQWDGRLRLSRGRAKEALNRVNAYLQEHPKDIQLLELRSSALSELGLADKALAVLETAFHLDPESASLANNLSYMYADRGIHLDKAERLIRQALTAEPGQAAYRDTLGWVFYKQGRFREAGNVFETMIRDESIASHPVILDHAGDAMWRLGRREQAVDLWQRAIDAAEDEEVALREIREIRRRTAAKIDAARHGAGPRVAPTADEIGHGAANE